MFRFASFHFASFGFASFTENWCVPFFSHSFTSSNVEDEDIARPPTPDNEDNESQRADSPAKRGVRKRLFNREEAGAKRPEQEVSYNRPAKRSRAKYRINKKGITLEGDSEALPILSNVLANNHEENVLKENNKVKEKEIALGGKKLALGGKKLALGEKRLAHEENELKLKNAHEELMLEKRFAHEKEMAQIQRSSGYAPPPYPPTGFQFSPGYTPPQPSSSYPPTGVQYSGYAPPPPSYPATGVQSSGFAPPSPSYPQTGVGFPPGYAPPPPPSPYGHQSSYHAAAPPPLYPPTGVQFSPGYAPPRSGYAPPRSPLQPLVAHNEPMHAAAISEAGQKYKTIVTLPIPAQRNWPDANDIFRAVPRCTVANGIHMWQKSRTFRFHSDIKFVECSCTVGNDADGYHASLRMVKTAGGLVEIQYDSADRNLCRHRNGQTVFAPP